MKDLRKEAEEYIAGCVGNFRRNSPFTRIAQEYLRLTERIQIEYRAVHIGDGHVIELRGHETAQDWVDGWPTIYRLEARAITPWEEV